MGKPTGFMEYKRQEPPHRPVAGRIGDSFEVELPMPEPDLVRQAARCMDCGIPFCHGGGCSLANLIPEFNDMVYRGRWRDAAELLHATNNFPEITGRICPAPCEAACTLNVTDDPVLICHIERQVAERAFDSGWVVPQRPGKLTGRKVAVIGSGPAGLAAAQQLVRAGHEVTVLEKSDRIGGLLRYGIPDFKLDKRILDRRLDQMRAEGVQFQTGVAAGEDLSAHYLRDKFDAVLLAMGAGRPRDLSVPGRELENVVFAMDFLTRQNRLVAGLGRGEGPSAHGRVVAVIGGGDTGSDCVGTSIRQGAKEVHQFEIMPRPPQRENPDTPWPEYPRILRTTSSHEEGCRRRWSVRTTELTGISGRVAQLRGVEVDWRQTPAGPRMYDREGSEFSIPVDLVVLAMGFVHVEHAGLVDAMGLKRDQRGNIAADNHSTSVDGVFVAGDAAMGASLVVRAIDSGRSAARAVHRWLCG